MLVILDGFGMGGDQLDKTNAVVQAKRSVLINYGICILIQH